MDRETIIKLAREVYGEHTKWEGAALERLERLVNLVAEHRDKWWEEQVKVEVYEAVLEERELCAKAADSAADNIGSIEFDVGASIAAAIRARGNT